MGVDRSNSYSSGDHLDESEITRVREDLSNSDQDEFVRKYGAIDANTSTNPRMLYGSSDPIR